MDIIYVIGILAAFLAGAYIRQPFTLFQNKKHTEEKPEPSREERLFSEQFNNLLNYTGKKQGDSNK